MIHRFASLERATPWRLRCWRSLVILCLLGISLAALQLGCVVPTAVILLLEPEDDAYVSEGVPDRSFGDSRHLRIGAANPSRGRRVSFLKFDLDRVPEEIGSAKLKLRDSEGSLAGVTLFKVCDDTWTEETLTWSNAPWDALCGRLGRSTDIDDEGWYTFEVESPIDEDGFWSFALVSERETGPDGAFSSSRSAYKPTLEVTLDP